MKENDTRKESKQQIDIDEILDEIKSYIYIPSSVYRFQFNKTFNFNFANIYIPYLKELGIDSVYSSPYYQARPGSSHGYNVTDPNKINPEVGNEKDYKNFCNIIEANGLSQVMDVVPNHMGIIGNNNHFWMDVLENGKSARYAFFFDIEWNPVKDELKNKVLLPILGNQYGIVLENQELKLEYNSKNFILRYYSHIFPIAPETYPVILEQGLEELDELISKDDKNYLEYLSVITAFKNIPTVKKHDKEKLEVRYREKEITKDRLSTLVNSSEIIKNFVYSRIKLFNGKISEPESFDLLDNLLIQQHYRIAFWQVASEEINYRRFFDINELAAIKMEDERVFDIYHEMLFNLLKDKKVRGLRIDHPDGLYDPVKYFEMLQDRFLTVIVTKVLKEKYDITDSKTISKVVNKISKSEKKRGNLLFIVVEKILERKEFLPNDWKIEGTVGYDYLNALNGLFIDRTDEEKFDKFYCKFTRLNIEFEDLLYQKKLFFATHNMPAEINFLGHYLNNISESDRHFRDFTLYDLIKAVREVIACFPVYRTYITETTKEISERDHKYIHIAVEKAKHRNREADSSVYEFIYDIMTLKLEDKINDEESTLLRDFIMRFQQISSPIMAKGLEDTVFYIYNRFVSLNEVGGDPLYFSYSINEFHKNNIDRNKYWPYSFITNSTHDTKRSFDVRMRLNVISENFELWNTSIKRWTRINNKHKTQVNGRFFPDKNIEYLIYQSLIGVWPDYPIKYEEWNNFEERIWRYIEKSIREAKVFTNWLNPDFEYEEAVKKFIFKILENKKRNYFLKIFLPAQRLISHYGKLNSLSALNITLGSPGVVDIYRGSELWDYSLVDPDNRRGVDFNLRWHLLNRVKELFYSDRTIGDKMKELLIQKMDSRIKIFLLWRALKFRNKNNRLFLDSNYIPLTVQGELDDNIVAFSRKYLGDLLVVVSGRFFSHVTDSPEQLPVGDVWKDNYIVVPDDFTGTYLFDIYTKNKVMIKKIDDKYAIDAAECFKLLPFAMLTNINIKDQK